MRTFVREPDRSPQDVVPCHRLHKIRRQYDKQAAKWFFSVVDVVAAREIDDVLAWAGGNQRFLNDKFEELQS